MRLNNFYTKAKYIIRLDDASHFSDLTKWNKIEKILDNNNILPTVAVIPNNQDNSIKYSEYNSGFWEKVKKWETKGWTIAIHGDKHLFHKINRRKLIFPYYNRSEFAGLSINEQRQKIKNALKIFFKNKINPTVWISPGHCFDNLTLEAIKNETTIKIISDGVSLHPYFYKGLHFIPQQLWKLKKKYFGIWTVCLHPDTMTDDEINLFEKSISALINTNNFIDMQKLKLTKNSKSLFDYLFAISFWIKYEIKIFLKVIKID